MNYKNTSWNSYLETLRVEIDQAISGCFSLSTHHNKYHRLTIGLSHFSKKLIDFVDDKRTLNQEELKNFQGLIQILLNLNHFLNDFSDFCIDKTIEAIGIDFFSSPLNKALEFIKNFNYYTQQLDLPLITVDERLLREEDNVIDIAQLLNFIQSRAILYREKNKDMGLLYENLANKVFALIETDKPDNQIIKDICIRRKEYLKRKRKNSSKNASSSFYGANELIKALKSKQNVRIIKLKDVDIDRSHCVHHGKHSNFFSGVLKSSKRIVSFEIYHSVIFSENEFNSFIQKVKTMSDANYFTTIPLIGVVLDEPFIIISEFMPQRSLFDWFHDPNNNEISNDNDSHISGLESGQQRKFKMQFDQNENMSSSSDIFKSRQSILTLNSSSSFGSYQQIRKESAPPKKELRQTIIALGVAYALRYLHSKGIVHMSLKMSEIFIDANGRPKIKLSKKARKKNSKIDKIHPKDVKAWTAPELIDINRLVEETADNDNEIDDDVFDEESNSSISIKEKGGIIHSTSVTSIPLESHSNSHSHFHTKSGKKDSKRRLSIKKCNSTTLGMENSSPAPLPPVANSNDVSPNGSRDLLNKSVSISTKVDVYAFGIMLWELLTKEIAFDGLSSQMIANEVVCCDQRPLIPQNCPANLMKFIQECWATDPKKRPDFDEICLMLESGNCNFPGTDTEELNSYKEYCARLNDQFNKANEKSSSNSEFAEFDKMQLTEPDSFYENPNLNIETMINSFIKEGSCEDLRFIQKLSELVKNSEAPHVNINAPFPTKSENSKDSKDKEKDKIDSTYIFTESSLSLLSTFFLSSNLKIRLIAVDLITYIYNNHLFNDERSIAGILPKIVLNISQISSLSINFVKFRITEAQEIVLTSMKLLTLLSSKYVTSGFINNKISNASISYIVNMAFSDCSSIREVSFDFYMSFLSKFQASNKLLMQFITKLAQFTVEKTTCSECIKIIKVIKLISRNERLFSLISLDEKSIETISQFLEYDKLAIKQEKQEEEEEEEENKNKEEEEEIDEKTRKERTSDASNYKFLLNMMKSNEKKGDGSLLQKLTEKQTPDDVVISSLRLLFILISGSNYLHYYTKMVNALAEKILSSNKVISSLSCAVLSRLIPAIAEKKDRLVITEDFDHENIPELNTDEFSFLTDEILLKISENLDEYSIRLFGAISSTFISATLNTRNDEIILKRLLKKMQESLKSIKSIKESKEKEKAEAEANKNNSDDKTNDDDDKNETVGTLFNKISFNVRPNMMRPNLSRNSALRPNFKIMKVQSGGDESKKSAFPLLFQKKNDAFAEEEKKREEEGRLAALVLESQSSQTPSSKVLLEAIDTFFDYYFFFDEKNYVDQQENDKKNINLSFDEEDKLRECLVFLSNMALDPNAALCIFKRIDKILHITSLKNSPAASTFFHVTLTYEVQEKIRKICQKNLPNDSSSEDEEDDDDENNESDDEIDEDIELINGRDFKDLIQDIIKKCDCFWNTVYFEDAMRLLEFFSTIPSARKLLLKFDIISKIKNYIKNAASQKQQIQPIIMEIQEEKKILENLKKQQLQQQKLIESLLMPQKNSQNAIYNYSENKDENDKTQKQFIENQQKNQILLRQIKQQQEKIDHLQNKEMKIRIHDSNLRILCNRILSRFV